MIRTLIVEDDRLVRAGLAEGLERAGYAVSVAASGEEALELVDRADPQLIVMDICLPGISGIEAARRILAERQVPLIFLTAFDQGDALGEAITLGGMTYLLKPITVKQLIPTVQNALARASDLNALRQTKHHLGRALQQSREVSMAVGMLIERHGVSAEEAFEVLRRHARDTRRNMADVARDVISGLQHPGART
jgi:response regulator NasT